MLQNNLRCGTHFILDLFGCKGHIDSLPFVVCTLDHVVSMLQLTVLYRKHFKFEPEGLTVMFLLSESHMSYHNFTESKTVTFDLFTCNKSNEINFNEVEGYLMDKFQASSSRQWVIDRGSVE